MTVASERSFRRKKRGTGQQVIRILRVKRVVRVSIDSDVDACDASKRPLDGSPHRGQPTPYRLTRSPRDRLFENWTKLRFLSYSCQFLGYGGVTDPDVENHRRVAAKFEITVTPSRAVLTTSEDAGLVSEYRGITGQGTTKIPTGICDRRKNARCETARTTLLEQQVHYDTRLTESCPRAQNSASGRLQPPCRTLARSAR